MLLKVLWVKCSPQCVHEAMLVRNIINSVDVGADSAWVQQVTEHCSSKSHVAFAGWIVLSGYNLLTRGQQPGHCGSLFQAA
jgi:hypothetical protein